MEKKKKLWQVLIPVLVALAVIVAFAISGTITRRADEKKPTAPTKVSVVNARCSGSRIFLPES